MSDSDPEEGYSVMDGYLVVIDEERTEETEEGRHTIEL